MSVILTGFSSKIGLALLNKYFEKGHTVYCLGRKDCEFPEGKSKKKLKKFFQLDFNSKSFNLDLEAIYNNFKNRKIDTIIHAAADCGKRETIKNQYYDDIKDLVNINFLNSAWFIKKSCDLLSMLDKEQNKSFVYISTQLAKYKGPSLSIYSASKAGINNLCNTLAHEYGLFGVRVNIVSPGKVNSNPNNRKVDISKLNIPLSKLATPEDVANAVLFLTSSQSKYISATNIDVNGGR